MFFVLRFWFGFLCFRCVYNAAETQILPEAVQLLQMAPQG